MDWRERIPTMLLSANEDGEKKHGVPSRRPGGGEVP
jgi:hypothetical protein